MKAFAEVVKSCGQKIHQIVPSKSYHWRPKAKDLHPYLRSLLDRLNLIIADDKITYYEKAQDSWSKYLHMDNSKIAFRFVGYLIDICALWSLFQHVWSFWDPSLPISQWTKHVRVYHCLVYVVERNSQRWQQQCSSKCKEMRKYFNE